MQLNRGDAKVILLCNSLIAIPALRELLFYNEVKAIVIPKRNKEVIATVKEHIEELPVDLIAVTKDDFSEKIRTTIELHQPTAVLMMTFPFMIPADLLTVPPKGFINFHYGRLPEYRGPEPIFTQILQQEKNPGLSVHVATTGIDDGPVIIQETVVYDELDSYAALQFKLSSLGVKLTGTLMKILSFGSMIPAIQQDETKARYHSKPTAADLMIRWKEMDSRAIISLINACNPWNKGAGWKISDETIIAVTEAEILDEKYTEGVAGKVISVHKSKGLRIGTADGKVVKVNIIFHPHFGFLSAHRATSFGITEGSLCE